MDDTTDREELIAKLQEAGREFGEMLRAQGAHEPDWEPLEKVLPLKWCAGFMFMGYSGRVRMYKHGFTRRYLNVDPEGNTYFYSSESDFYFRVPKSVAIKGVFAGLREMGFKRTTPYDDEAIAKKHKAMAEAGWTTVSLDVSKSNEPTVIRGEESQAGSS